MIKIRPQRLVRRSARALALGVLTLVSLLTGLVLQAIDWVLVPPLLLSERLGDSAIAPVLVAVWQPLWPALEGWTELIQTVVGVSLGSAEVLAQGITTWVVLLPLALLGLILGLFELLGLQADLSRFRVEADPITSQAAEPHMETAQAEASSVREEFFSELDASEERIELMQHELDQLRVSLINAGLPNALDDPHEPLEQARLSCEAVRLQLKALRGQQQVIQARAMGFRA